MTYISLDSAIQAVCKDCRMKENMACYGRCNDIDNLKSIPAADVRPVVRAIWRYKTMSVPGGKGQTYAKWCCTVCKYKVKERTNFCPNCGADMRPTSMSGANEEES